MNHFDPTLRNEAQLRTLIHDEAGSVDADAIIAEVARWVGWYRLETMPPNNASPCEQHAEADRIIATIEKLRGQLAQLSPALRCQVRDGLSRLQMDMPDLARLQACFMVGKENLVEPRQGQQAAIPARDNALRRVREAVAAAAPALGAGAADRLAADLVRDALGVVVPSDAKELRRICRG